MKKDLDKSKKGKAPEAAASTMARSNQPEARAAQADGAGVESENSTVQTISDLASQITGVSINKGPSEASPNEAQDKSDKALLSAFSSVRSINTVQKQPDLKVVRAAIDGGANVMSTNQYGTTALMMAGASDKSGTVIELLIERGGHPLISAQSNDGTTALMCAAKYNNPAGAKILLARGADPNVRDKMGRTALDWGTARGTDVLGLLAQASRAPWSADADSVPAPSDVPGPALPPGAPYPLALPTVSHVKLTDGASTASQLPSSASSNSGTTLPKELLEWTVDNVATFIKEASGGQLKEYEAVFRKQKICGEDLANLEAENLKNDLGILNGVHQKRIIAAIRSRANLLSEGRALIIVIKGQKGDKFYREGADADLDNCRAIATALGCTETKVLSDLKGGDVSSHGMLEFVIDNRKWAAEGGFIVLMTSSHGGQKKGQETIVSGPRDVVLVKQLLRSLGEGLNPKQFGKIPKFCFFNKCRGHLDTDVPGPQADSIDTGDMHAHHGPFSNFVLAFSTIEDYKSYRDEVTGSYFFQALLDVVTSCHAKSTMTDILSKLRKHELMIANGQMPPETTTLLDPNAHFKAFLERPVSTGPIPGKPGPSAQ